MNDLEKELRRALQREDPAPGLLEAVLFRIEGLSSPPVPRRRLRPFARRGLGWAAAAVAASLLVVAGLVRYEHQREARTGAAQAAREAMIGLEVASAKLNATLNQVRRINHGNGEREPQSKRRRGMEQL